MNEKKYRGVLLCLVCFAAGFIVGYLFNERTSNRNQDRAYSYESGSENAQAIIDRTEQRAAAAEREMREARTVINTGLSGIGDIRAINDRLAEGNSTAAQSADRIEEGISAIESILQQAEDGDRTMETNRADGWHDIAD